VTLGDSINQIMSLFNEDKEVSDLRKYLESYINSDKYSFKKWGEKFDSRFKEINFGKTFSEMIEKMNSLNSKDNDPYDKFILYYMCLEMFNITKERAGKKVKKFNFKSLNTDAQHAWYASFSDYLVTDDKGLQIKAFLTYKHFKIATKVLSSKDFINSRTLLENQEESHKTFVTSLKYDMKNALQLYKKRDLLNDSITHTFKTSYPYFNYFNRIQIYETSNNVEFALFCERNWYSNFVMYREEELIINKLYKIIGNDIDGKSKYDFELDGTREEKIINTWKIDNNIIRLVRSSIKNRGIFMVLQIIE